MTDVQFLAGAGHHCIYTISGAHNSLLSIWYQWLSPWR